MLKEMNDPPLSTHNRRQNFQYDKSTSALRSVSWVYLTLLDLFNYKVARGGSFNFDVVFM